MLDDAALERSSVVANNAMNRGRGLTGVNSYARCLGANPLDLLPAGSGAWLDLCCGSGRALIEAAGLTSGVRIVGVDLVDYFDSLSDTTTGPELICASLATWSPDRRFDLITCVHGLHYIGDKLDLLMRAATWLTPQGRLVADFDAAGVKDVNGKPIGARLTRALRGAGFTYDSRRHRIWRTGPTTARLPFRYEGADDQAGSNYTGQPVVDSYYTPA